MSRAPALLFVVVLALPGCGDSDALASAAMEAPQGHVASTFTLEAEPHCEGCITRVTEELNWIEGVSVIDVRVGTPTLKVWHDPEKVTPQYILEALTKAGEKATLVP